MDTFFELMMPSMIQSLVLSLVALGIMIPFKILHFPDLTSEGSYPLGGALCASMIAFGIDPIFSMNSDKA
jgi:putative ABC transport system permease protein